MFLPSSRWLLGSLLFIADMFGDMTVQEPESREVIRLGTDRFPPALVQVSLINEAQLRHGLSQLGKMDPDPSGDKANHTLAVHAATIDLIHHSSPKSNSEGDREVYMVGQGDQPSDKTTKEIQREVDEEIAREARLARDAERGKMHNGLQYNSGALEDEPRGGATSRKHHTKFNS
jgi:hypothetical protein